MAQLTASFKADDLALNYIYPTLESVSALIPGITINPEVSVEVGAASAYFYKNNDPVVTEGTAGRVLSTNAAGNSRVDILLNRSFQVDELIPSSVQVALTVDVVGDYLVKAAAKIANEWSKKGLAKMLDEGTAITGSASTKDTIYGNIIDSIKTFDEANPNMAQGANYVIVTPAVYALLRKAPEFIGSSSPISSIVTDGLVGSIGGLQVVLGKQLGTITAAEAGFTTLTGVEFVLGSFDAFAAPTGFRNFRTIESELYFGTKIQAEVVYGFAVANASRIFFRAVSAVL
jgi:hypothetical protein